MSGQNIQLTVDAIVFGVRKGELHVLLVKRRKEPFKGEYAFPGGFVYNSESLKQAVLRELAEETNIKDVFVKKLTAYGDVKRDPRGRVVTVAYLALIDAEKYELKSRADALLAEWLPVSSVRKLAFDHHHILQEALQELRLEVQTTNLAAQLLPETFTLSELQSLYESILGKKLDKRNFRKRIKALGMLQETRQMKMEGAHRPARLHSFREKEYRPLKERIQVFV